MDCSSKVGLLMRIDGKDHSHWHLEEGLTKKSLFSLTVSVGAEGRVFDKGGKDFPHCSQNERPSKSPRIPLERQVGLGCSSRYFPSNFFPAIFFDPIPSPPCSPVITQIQRAVSFGLIRLQAQCCFPQGVVVAGLVRKLDTWDKKGVVGLEFKMDV